MQTISTHRVDRQNQKEAVESEKKRSRFACCCLECAQLDTHAIRFAFHETFVVELLKIDLNERRLLAMHLKAFGRRQVWTAFFCRARLCTQNVDNSLITQSAALPPPSPQDSMANARIVTRRVVATTIAVLLQKKKKQQKSRGASK